MNKLIYMLETTATLPNGISKLEGGSYDINSIISAIQTFTSWALRIGIAVSGVALIVSFIIYAVADVDQKPE